MDKPEIDALIAAAQRGDASAWDAFFAHYNPLIRSVVSWPKWRLDVHTREDVMQSIRQEIVKAITNLRGDTSIDYFIKQICIHRIIDEIRREARTNRRVTALAQYEDEHGDIAARAGGENDPVAQVLMFEKASVLKGLIEQMDESCRAAIREFYFEHLAYKEIAARRGISINTVGARLSKCLDKLRRLVRSHEYFRDDGP